MSTLRNRTTFHREPNRFRNMTTVTLKVIESSYLDTGYYNCQQTDDGTNQIKLFEMHYVFVHPPLIPGNI